MESILFFFRYRVVSLAPFPFLWIAGINSFPVDFSSPWRLVIYCLALFLGFCFLRALGYAALEDLPKLLLPTSKRKMLLQLVATAAIGAVIGLAIERTFVGAMHGSIGGVLSGLGLLSGFHREAKDWFERTNIGILDHPLRLRVELMHWQISLAIVIPAMVAAALSLGIEGPLGIEGLFAGMQWSGRGGAMAAMIVAFLITAPLSAIPAYQYEMSKHREIEYSDDTKEDIGTKTDTSSDELKEGFRSLKRSFRGMNLVSQEEGLERGFKEKLDAQERELTEDQRARLSRLNVMIFDNPDWVERPYDCINFIERSLLGKMSGIGERLSIHARAVENLSSVELAALIVYGLEYMEVLRETGRRTIAHDVAKQAEEEFLVSKELPKDTLYRHLADLTDSHFQP